MDHCRAEGTENSVVTFGSTSKITRAGGGVAFLAASPDNLTAVKKRLAVQTIGPDKLNQLRHVRFLRDLDGVKAHMRRHAEILRPKFESVLRYLDEHLEGIATWTRPKGGYFISVNTPPARRARWSASQGAPASSSPRPARPSRTVGTHTIRTSAWHPATPRSTRSMRQCQSSSRRSSSQQCANALPRVEEAKTNLAAGQSPRPGARGSPR